MDSFLFPYANIFLSFFEFGKDDLVEMDKAVKLISDGNIKLYTNSHLFREVKRNREARIASGFNKIDTMKYGGSFPSYCSEYPEMTEIKQKLRDISALHSSMIEKIRSDIKNRSLKADLLIKEMFLKAQHKEVEFDIIQRARHRCELGEPPGKKGSIGDAIHWECLLDQCKFRIDIVSHDGDFASDLDPTSINPVLSDEWRQRKNSSSISLFVGLTSYFKSRFPQVELSKEFEKDEAIAQLVLSSSFAETHKLVAMLSKHKFFTQNQISYLFRALVDNDQVNRLRETRMLVNSTQRLKRRPGS